MEKSLKKEPLALWLAVLLAVWMATVMFLGWIVMEGPIVCSIIKRCELLRDCRHTWVVWLGEPTKEGDK